MSLRRRPGDVPIGPKMSLEELTLTVAPVAQTYQGINLLVGCVSIGGRAREMAFILS
jgi:hypothetical protein